MKKIRSRLLYKYIISYLLIFLIPFFVMSIFVYQNSVTNLRKEIEQSNLNKLKQAMNISNERIHELENLSARISYDSRLTPYMMKHYFYGGEGIKELKKYKANSSIIEELFIYYHGDDKIYSANGLYSLGTVTDNMYTFNDSEKDEFINILHTPYPVIKPAASVTVSNSTKKRILAYLYPISPNSQNPHGTVMYFIKESVLTGLIQNVLDNFKGNTYIIDANNQIIASTINDEKVYYDQLNDEILNNEGVSNVRINEKEYSIVSTKSEENGWTFITLMEADQFFEQVFQMKTFIIIILSFLLFVGLTMAILLGKKQYQPIQNLFEQVKTKSKNNIKKSGYNELEKIEDTISDIFDSQEKINETLYLQKPLASEQLLVKMLKGELKDNEKTTSMLQKFNIKMYDSSFFVIILYFENENYGAGKIEERNELFKFISNISYQDSVTYGVDLLYHDAMAFIVSLNSFAKTNAREEIVKDIQKYIAETEMMNPTIGVGTLYNDRSNINRSYIEALTTLEYKFSVSPGSVIYFDEINFGSEQKLGYPLEKQAKLTQSLKQGDQAVANETLQQIFEDLTNENLSIQTLKCVCFDIINTVVKTSSEFGLDYVPNFEGIVDFKSIKQLEIRLKKAIEAICVEVMNKKETHNIKLRDNIIEYLNQNYHMYGLSLESIAINYQLSVPYLSRFIKEQTGKTFTQYVFNLRMEKVEKQLIETDKPIKEIILSVGYKDVSNFTRNFRKVKGIPPGQYRKLYRK